MKLTKQGVRDLNPPKRKRREDTTPDVTICRHPENAIDPDTRTCEFCGNVVPEVST